MVRLFVRHNVSDYAAWRNVYDEFDEERGDPTSLCWLVTHTGKKLYDRAEPDRRLL